jgi:hypothetical protein
MQDDDPLHLFFWIMCHGNTRTREFLHHHGALGLEFFPFCPSVAEDIDHLFLLCSRVAMFWATVCPAAPPREVLDLLMGVPVLTGAVAPRVLRH